ncbi:Helicase-like protein [Emericellopsis cladophorae]|uniref:DNA helicase n=1 Tax=Emericellopsis cladophorae TaxID=2686198 RepID=A0A9P9XUL8_9HYPO|nr:Helicase-like protein [Emericellopsis cladophorae]KAI6777873.1 Helicase-like protein [Emericellopsis cladophorae]
MRAISGLWENVRAEANRQRFEEWEAAEQRRVKAALNEAVNLSEQKLQARQLGLDSEIASLDDPDTDGSVNDDPLDDDSQSDTADTRISDLTDSDNMSTTDDDEPDAADADVADEVLTQDQLRVKYAGANIKSASPTDANISTKLGTSVSSDESVDMDDDLGESDQIEDSDAVNEGRRNGTNAHSEDSDSSDDGHDDGAPNGLLNMLFDDSELKELSAEAPGTEHMTGAPEVGNDGTSSGPAPASTRLDSAPDEQLNLNTSTEGDVPGSTVLHEESEKPIRQETTPDAKSTMDYEQDQDKARLIPEESHKQTTEVPFLLRGTLREYQHQGLDWLAGLYANNTNGILADEMGLGKTIQTIALLAHLACQHEVWGPHLVVVPTSVMLNWEMEFKKWCPGFKILAYYGSQEERKRKRQGWNNDDMWNVCITSYQLVLQDQQVFKRRRWHYLVLDEAHNIKNFKSQRWQTLLGFNTQARLLLTGTPLQNNLTELWSLLFFLMPAQNGVGGFADLEEFHDWFHKPESQILENGREQMDDEALAIISKLHKVLRPYLLRRLKADVEKQMPGKYEHVEFCRLSKRQRELYDGFLSRADTKNTLASGNYMSIINCLMQLRKVCNHPDLFVDRQIVTSLRMQKSVPALYRSTVRTLTQGLLRPEPMSKVDLGFLNLVPAQYESIPRAVAEQVAKLSLSTDLLDYRETQRVRARNAYVNLDPTTVTSSIVYIESAFRWGRFEELQHCVYLNALRRQQTPIYGKDLVELLTIDAGERLRKPRPKAARGLLAWFEQTSSTVGSMALSLEQRAESMRTAIEKFSCVTPSVVTCDIGEVVLGHRAAHAFTERDLQISKPRKWTPWLEKQSPPDPWHEARLRLSIQFPDKRLLQYDCGKLQVLDRLLRKLQAGGHRALIFTQMTKVLDILEQFLNIHGHKYLRLDGATKVEQRQILTDRFNNDPRILCFILSTRSGGLGINLTGADTVIFYDQDWNPAMDKQCQDRCHRIGQTRDVHIYRLVSEHTIEANILRKASQKQMLDDVVIQEGTFTTDAFNQMSVRDLLREKVDTFSEGVSAADAALDRVLGGSDGDANQRKVGRVLEQAEDREDIDAARVAEREIEADDADFVENTSLVTPEDSTGRNATSAVRDIDTEGQATEGSMQDPNAWGAPMGTIDDFMLRTMADAVKGTKLELPRDKKKGKKKGRDTRKR